MDQYTYYDQLVGWLHLDGMTYRRCHEHGRMVVHRRGRDPVLDLLCGDCHRVFNAFPDAALHCIKRRPEELVLIAHGFAQGVSTAQLARELDCDRTELLNLWHRLQDLAFRYRDIMPLDDEVLEANETCRNAGKKCVADRDPEDPPGCRTSATPGHGTWEYERPPVCGVVGQESGQIRLTVTEPSDGETLDTPCPIDPIDPIGTSHV
jgi:hypothetical protein